MVTPVHPAFTTDGSDHIVLRLADVGAVLVAALSAVAPGCVADRCRPASTSLWHASATRRSASTTIGYAHWLKVLAWLLPLLALLCFAGVDPAGR